ncbi:MAG: copper chaperone PCu(A)C [Actinomycetota bacterium]|nr:copper chaperone PCu(A)C [Actinomycetota bacterium]
MRLPWPSVAAAALLAAVGTAGLIRGAVPQSVASTAGNTGAAPIVITNAYVVPPAPPTAVAAAYFTVYNTTNTADTLLSVATGAGASSVLHTYVNGVMTAVVSGGVTIPAHGSLVLSVGKGHVMISELFSPLKPGETVDIALTFANAGAIDVTAPVLALGAAGPGGGVSPTTGVTK